MCLLEFFIVVIILMLFSAFVLTLGMFLIKYLIWIQGKVFSEDEDEDEED